MYLKKLKLAGYGSYHNVFEENQVELGKVNVIIGANGAGKSNLVSFLEMVAFMMTKGLRSYVARHGGIQSLLYFGPKQTEEIRGCLEFCDEEGQKEDTYTFALRPTVDGRLYFAEERMSYWDTNHDEPYQQDFGEGQLESCMVDYSNATERIFCGYLRQLRVFHFNDTSMDSRFRRIGNGADDVYLRSDGGNIAAFLYRMREEHFEHYNRIQRYVRMVLPQFLEFCLEKDANGYISLRWQNAGSEEIFGAHQMSDGTLRFIALMTLLLQPSDYAPITIILDEPEIGLHPYALSVLADAIRLAKRNSQLIIATQSPLLLNYFSPEDIITAEYDPKDQRSCLRRYKEEELAEWLAEYSLGELWEKNVLGGTPL